MPPKFDVNASESSDLFYLVKDPFAQAPNFEEFVYMGLEGKIILLEILWWFIID